MPYDARLVGTGVVAVIAGLFLLVYGGGIKVFGFLFIVGGIIVGWYGNRTFSGFP